MTDQPKRRGPKPSGKPRARGINFSVSAEHEEWLKQLPDRSAWLAKKIDDDRATQATGVTPGDTPTNKRPADDVEPSNGAR